MKTLAYLVFFFASQTSLSQLTTHNSQGRSRTLLQLRYGAPFNSRFVQLVSFSSL
ncbi:hypothetical protein GLYMA_03G019350v4 [Glycine max]|nr:hypothetical protein GLYMA_03G019350v4 [Glycine max]KAH1068262.1 hypothetical protein GYH30_005988 [Glycine max]